jgi:hypothetical protein
MNTSSFEMTVSLQDDRHLGIVRALVVCAAQYAGCGAADAAQFAGAVAEVVSASLVVSQGASPLPVTVRRQAGPIEVLVDGHTLTLDV